VTIVIFSLLGNCGVWKTMGKMKMSRATRRIFLGLG
jgi:hypothetical protein